MQELIFANIAHKSVALPCFFLRGAETSVTLNLDLNLDSLVSDVTDKTILLYE
jgi:hypothetical protein